MLVIDREQKEVGSSEAGAMRSQATVDQRSWSAFEVQGFIKPAFSSTSPAACEGHLRGLQCGQSAAGHTDCKLRAGLCGQQAFL